MSLVAPASSDMLLQQRLEWNAGEIDPGYLSPAVGDEFVDAKETLTPAETDHGKNAPLPAAPAPDMLSTMDKMWGH